MSAALSPAAVAGLKDRAVSRASHIFFPLTSLTDDAIDALAPGDRRLLQGQLERVHRMVAGATVVSGARKDAALEGGEARRSKAAFLDELRDGWGRE
jgi:hypothetical protein